MITGTIYKIECFKTKQIYYGSTTKTLFEKMREYFENYIEYKKGAHPYKAPFALFKGNDYKFFLINTADYEHVFELKNETLKYIKENDCINKLFVDKVKKKAAKEYREANKDAIKEYNKAYKEANKDAIKEYNKAYKEANKDAINEKRRQQRADKKQSEKKN